MEHQHPTLRPSPMIMGGVFLGFWLYVDFFRIPVFGHIDLALWNFWGVIGMAIAGGFYASKVANYQVRIGIWIAMGIALAFLAMAAVFNQVGEAFAALFTIVGTGLIMTALPGGWNDVIHDHNQTQGQWQTVDGSQPRQ